MTPGLPLIETANRIHRAILRYRESAWEPQCYLATFSIERSVRQNFFPTARSPHLAA
jgi:hypothetical protein